MDLITHIQARIEECKRNLQRSIDKMDQAMQDRDMYQADLAGYERALSAEMRATGSAPMPPPVTQGSLALNNIPPRSESISKAEFTRQFVSSNSGSGVTPSDIFNAFVEQGIPIKKPYVYALVQRLQKQQAIRSRRGKYYPGPLVDRTQGETEEFDLKGAVESAPANGLP